MNPGAIQITASIRHTEWRVVGVSVSGKPHRRGVSLECGPGEQVKAVEVVIGTNLGVVAGRVISSADKKPIEGVWVDLSRRDEEVLAALPEETDKSGSFFFHSVPAGPYVLGVARSQGKLADEGSKRDIVVESGGVVHLDLVLAGAG